MSNLVKLLLGLIVAVLIISVTYLIKPILFEVSNKLMESERFVTVRGVAEREVMANHILFELKVSTLVDDIINESSKYEHNCQKAQDFMFAKGIGAQDIAMRSLEVFTNRRKDIPKNLVTCNLVVSTSKVLKARELLSSLDSLVKEGISVKVYDYQIAYGYTKLNDIKPSMVEEANKNAKDAALVFAKHSNATLGKIRQARQGLFSMQDGSRPELIKVRVVTQVDYYLKN